MENQVKPTLHLPIKKTKAEPKSPEPQPSHEEVRRQLGQFLLDPLKAPYCPR